MCRPALIPAAERVGNAAMASTIRAAAAAEFDDTELADLVRLISTINAWNRVNVAAHVWPVD
jgi:alkylhydroperoxidase family enzyme